MAALQYILAMKDILQASWSYFQHDGVAPCILSERSPLPPALSAKNLAGEQTPVSKLGKFKYINRHPAKRNDDSASDSISNTENWLDWNGELDNPNVSEDDCEGDNEFEIVSDDGINDPECQDQRNMCDTMNLLELIGSTLRSN